MKRDWIIIIVFAIILIVGAYMVSPKTDTTIDCHGVSKSSNKSYIMVSLYYTEMDNGTPNYVYLPNKRMLANLTDEKGESSIHFLTTDSAGRTEIKGLKNEMYNLTVSYAGENLYKPSQWTGTVDLRTKYYVPNGTVTIWV